MGHTSVQFTQDEYMGGLPVMQQIAADKMESRLFRIEPADGGGGRVV